MVKSAKKDWYVYIVRCCDNSLYTGISTDVNRRVKEHNSPDKGGRYTRGTRPVKLEYSEEVHTRSAALKREHQIKKLTKAAKESLILSQK
jgi:putative endonuclease